MNFSASLVIISRSGLASIHLVKESMATSKYLTTPEAFGSGPSMSIPHMAKGQGEHRYWRLSGEVHCMSANSWHRLHLLVMSRAFALSVGE